MLLRNIADNALRNVQVRPFALSDAEGILALQTVFSNAAVTTFHASEYVAEFVVARTADELLRSEGKIQAVKIDVEGHEPQVLRGMQGILDEQQPQIIIEFDPHMLARQGAADPCAHLAELMARGYRLSIIEGDGRLQAVNRPAEIVDYWRALNRKLDTIDDRPLELAALRADTQLRTTNQS